MARLTTAQKLISQQTRGRFGRPSTYGRAHFGFNLLGADDSLSGIYKIAQFKEGRAVSLRPFHWPKNPRTEAQQANRSKFADGVTQYRALTPEQLAVINKVGQRLGMTGYNYFLSKYLRSH